MSDAVFHQRHANAEYDPTANLAFSELWIDDAPAIEGADDSSYAKSAYQLVEFHLDEMPLTWPATRSEIA